MHVVPLAMTDRGAAPPPPLFFPLLGGLTMDDSFRAVPPHFPPRPLVVSVLCLILSLGRRREGQRGTADHVRSTCTWHRRTYHVRAGYHRILPFSFPPYTVLGVLTRERECLTDNGNRTLHQIREILNRHKYVPLLLCIGVADLILVRPRKTVHGSRRSCSCSVIEDVCGLRSLSRMPPLAPSTGSLTRRSPLVPKISTRFPEGDGTWA